MKLGLGLGCVTTGNSGADEQGESVLVWKSSVIKTHSDWKARRCLGFLFTLFASLDTYSLPAMT